MDFVLIEGIYLNRSSIAYLKPYKPKNPIYADEDWCRVHFSSGDDFVEFKMSVGHVLHLLGASSSAAVAE